MKNIKPHILLAAILLSTGCQQSKDTPNSTTTDLQLNVAIGTMESRAAAISGTEFMRESEINIVLTDYVGTTNNYNRSGIYTYKDQGSGGVWFPKNIKTPLQLSEKEAMALAHYPAQLPVGASYNVATKLFTPVVTTSLAFGDLLAGQYNSDNSFWFSFAIGTPQNEVFMAEGEIDYMHGKMTNAQAISTDDKLAQIKMNHGLTMVVFNLFKSDQNPSPCVVKSIKIKNINSANAISSGTFSIPNGEFLPTNAVEYNRTMDNFPNNSYFGMLLFPAAIQNNEVIAEFMVDNQIYTLPIDGCEWDAGYVNLYRVRFTPARAELVDIVKVIDWGTGTNKDFEIN